MDERALADDLAFAHELADAAARLTLARFGERVSVSMKDDETPVTDTDVEVEGRLRDAIAERFPDDGVRGEEHPALDGRNGRVWVIDPIDGTRLFAEGIPLWTTLIALSVDGSRALGLADAPALGERYHATRGGGAWRGERRLRVSPAACLADSFVVHSSLEEWTAAGDGDALLRVATAARGTRGLSDAWGQLLVAQGSADALLEHEPCFEWDWAATSVIVEEAGGRLTTSDGAPPAPGRDLVVTNGLVHDETLRVLAG
jgi:histidinol-phosphatase